MSCQQPKRAGYAGRRSEIGGHLHRSTSNSFPLAKVERVPLQNQAGDTAACPLSKTLAFQAKKRFALLLTHSFTTGGIVCPRWVRQLSPLPAKREQRSARHQADLVDPFHGQPPPNSENRVRSLADSCRAIASRGWGSLQ